jgi:hypothetical protein
MTLTHTCQEPKEDVTEDTDPSDAMIYITQSYLYQVSFEVEYEVVTKMDSPESCVDEVF